MKKILEIHYGSDFHLNHYVRWAENQEKWEERTREYAKQLFEKKVFDTDAEAYVEGNKEVLILNGDFGEWNSQGIWFLKVAADYYKQIYLTLGNHDYYLLSQSQKKKYGDSIGRVQNFLDLAKEIPGVIPLHRGTDTYKGITFAGDTLWYLPRTIEDWAFFRNVSNDSRLISYHGYGIDDMIRKLYKESMDWYESLPSVDVMITHVPPIEYAFSQYGKGNGCYVTPVVELKAKEWICGHTHDVGIMEKAGTTFRWNCFGYPQEGKSDCLHMLTIEK